MITWIIVGVVSFIVVLVVIIVVCCCCCCAAAKAGSQLLVDQPNPNVQMSGMRVYDNNSGYTNSQPAYNTGGNFSVNASVNQGYSG